MSEDWSHPEIVRAVNGLKEVVERVETKMDALDERYVRRDLYLEKHSHLAGRVDELGQRVVDVEASQARLVAKFEDGVTAVRKDMQAAFQRLHEDSRQSVRAWIAPVVTGLVVGGVLVVLNVLIGG